MLVNNGDESSKSSLMAGFTMVELLIVVALIGILSMTVMWIYQTSILRAKNAKAQSDLNRIAKSIRQLEVDTEKRPLGVPIYTTCGTTANTPVAIDSSSQIGILQGDTTTFPGWSGPYMVELPTDPWGNSYKYDTDYLCIDSGVVQGLGCEDEVNGKTLDVIYSTGVDKTDGVGFNEDNIVIPLCH